MAAAQEEQQGEGEQRLRDLRDEISKALPKKEGESLDFLKREEIKTMKKDIEALRELEADKERERIITLEPEKERMVSLETKPEKEVKPEVKLEKPELREKIPEKEKQPQKKQSLPEELPLKETSPKEDLSKEAPIEETIIPIPPKKPSPFLKILVRSVFLLASAGLTIFLVWSFLSKKQDSNGYVPEENGKEPEKQEIVVPIPFFPVKETITFEVKDKSEILGLVQNIETASLAQNSFTQVIIKNIKEGKLISLADLAFAFSAQVPQGLEEKIDLNDFNFFAYAQKEGQREVFVIKIKDKNGLAEILKDWEQGIEKDGLFVIDKKLETTASAFRGYTFSSENFPIRFLTVSTEDKGICYGIHKDYLLFATSFTSMEQAIKALKAELLTEMEKKIGQLFIIGFDENEVTPELESFFEKYRPGGVLLLSKNIESAEQLKKLAKDLQDLAKRTTNLPLFITIDQEGGPISRIGFLTEKTAQSEITDTDNAFAIGLERGKELKGLGVNMNLAPVLDLMKATDFYFNRTFQKSAEISGELAKAIINGQKESVLTTIKHFPGYMNVNFNPESKLARILTPETSQFRKAMEASPEAVMLANAVYTDIDSVWPLTFSTKGISYLKAGLGSDVLVITDDLAQTSLLNVYSLKQIVTKPIEAGVDIMIFSGWKASVTQALDTFSSAVKNNEVSAEKIETAVARIIKLKESLK